MYSSAITAITRRIAAAVIGVHAASLEAVAAQARRREEAAWTRVDNTQQEIEQLEKLADVQEMDAALASSAADDIRAAVAAELDILPFLRK